MFFKSMEIYGFKSFPDKTILNFDTKMTAVVGSNGNGKSNISDALRWVMGEQGAKSLRGDKMEDVIFHGTMRRKSMGFAKVTLTIDNSDGTLRGYGDEVVISRKLYRSGESEYRINGNKALLKNINEMFMGTGLGRDGYSVIGQGKVSEIVESGGAKRREVFEEAAGVSKFLAQKKDAENRLSKTEDNLLRIRDIAKELEDRIPVLEKQSEKAKKAKVLLQRQEELDITVSVYELSQLDKTISETEDKILLSKGECEILDRDIEKLNNANEELNNKKLTLKAALEQLQAGDEATKERQSDIKSAVAVLNNNISHANSEIERLKGEIDTRKSGKDNILSDIANANSEIETKTAKIESNKSEISRLQQQLADFDKDNKELSDANAALNKEQTDLFLKQTRLTLEKQQAEGKLLDNTSRLEAAKKQAEESSKKITEQKSLLSEAEGKLKEAQDSKQEAENKLAGYTKLFSGKEERLKNAKAEIDSLNAKYQQGKQRLDVLQGIVDSMAGYAASVKNIMAASKQGRLGGILGTVADIISVEKRYAVAIEIALGAAVQNIVTQNEEAAKRSMRYLKEGNLGRATFLPLTSVTGRTLSVEGLSDEEGFEGIASELVTNDSRFDGIINSVLGRTAVVDDIDSASVIAKKYGYKFRIVTLDGQVINAGGSFTGGSVKNDAGIITRKQELQSISDENKKLSDKIKEKNEAIAPLSAEVTKMSIEMEGFSETVANAKLVIAQLDATVKGIKELLTQLRQQRDDAEDLCDSIEAGEKADNDRVEQLARELEELNNTISANEEKLSKHRESLDNAEDSRKELADKIAELNFDNLNLDKDIEHLKERITELNNSLGEIDSGTALQEQQIEEQNKLIEGYKAEIESQNKAQEELNIALGENKKLIEANISETDAIEQKMTQNNASVLELTTSKEKYSSDLARQEERKNFATEQVDKIVSGLWDKYEITRSEAKQKAQPVEDIIEAKSELSEIKRKIAALGNVNYSSIEELEEVNSRYGELSTQLSDVETSKRELEKLINDLTADIKQRFTESFNAINEHFGVLFSEIFGGGEARLHLSDPEDVLSSEVEIYAAPPGKVIKNLSLLSGGEKSMVALTIYLAILLHRPTPFCMLDEVDAALDDVNVQKYATYLKRFSRNTQLMVITHRRGTIEMCDVLYGVFMQEKGVSSLLRQEITDDLDIELD